MKRFLFFFLPILIGTMLAGCGKKEAYVHIQTLDNTTVIDSTDTLNTQPFPPEDSFACYPIYYIGPPQDTYRLAPRPIETKEDAHPNLPYSIRPNSQNLRITVAPFRLNFQIPEWVDSSYSGGPKVYPTKAYASFGIFFQNLSDTSLYLGYANLLMGTVRQVQSENGTWKDMEQPIKTLDFCATYRKEIFLPPQQVLVAKLPRYTRTGALRTFRLRYISRSNDTVYSNTFMD